jgi:hypothetical protein
MTRRDLTKVVMLGMTNGCGFPGVRVNGGLEQEAGNKPQESNDVTERPGARLMRHDAKDQDHRMAHTLTGKIVAVGQPTSEYEIAFCGEADQAILVTEIDEELLEGLHQTQVVDIDRKTLTKR